MQQTSDIYKELLADYHTKQIRLAIGDVADPEDGCDESMLIELKTTRGMFSSESGPAVGCCVSGEIDVELIPPDSGVPRQARLAPYVRLTDGVRYSEWIQKGVFYVDTRETIKGDSVDRLRLHGYDDMLKTEQDYPASTLQWPATDIEVVREIAAFIGVELDERSVELMVHSYLVQYPGQYSCRETLGHIAAMYGGCFVMSDLGKLLLVTFFGIPPETNHLVTHAGRAITFGGVRIRV